jgi:transposase-like protein
VWYNSVSLPLESKTLKMTRRTAIRLLTDSAVKKEQALKAVGKPIKQYTDSQKVDAVKSYLALGGNLKLVSRTLGIPYYTLKDWKSSNWWKNLTGEFKKEEKLELSSRLTRIIGKAMEEIEDRVSQGDFVLNQKTGEMVRKPMQARDLAVISNGFLDRKDILDKQTEEKQDIMTNEDKLAALAERFAKLAEKALEKPAVNVTDVVYVKESE